MSAPQKAHPFANTITPPPHISPFTGTPQQQQTPPNALSHSQMAAVSAPHTSQGLQSLAQQSPQATLAPPLSPEQLAKEKERVGLLFEINQVLLHELVRLQQQGKGGNVQYPQQPNSDDANKASTDYVEYEHAPNLNHLALVR